MHSSNGRQGMLSKQGWGTSVTACTGKGRSAALKAGPACTAGGECSMSRHVQNTACTTQHSTAQHSTAQHSTAQHSTAQHSTAQRSTAPHSTAQQTLHTKPPEQAQSGQQTVDICQSKVQQPQQAYPLACITDIGLISVDDFQAPRDPHVLSPLTKLLHTKEDVRFTIMRWCKKRRPAYTAAAYQPALAASTCKDPFVLHGILDGTPLGKIWKLGAIPTVHPTRTQASAYPGTGQLHDTPDDRLWNSLCVVSLYLYI